MNIESVPNRNSPPAVLLRESYREGGKVKKRTLLNLSDWAPDLVEGLRTLLKGDHAVADDGLTIHRSLPHGHVAAVLGTLRRIGLVGLLGRPRARSRDLVYGGPWRLLRHPAPTRSSMPSCSRPSRTSPSGSSPTGRRVWRRRATYPQRRSRMAPLQVCFQHLRWLR